MPDYRMYVIGDDGLFYKPIELPNCPDNQYAFEAAKPLVDGHDVELWQLDREVAVIDHRTKSDNAPLMISASCAVDEAEAVPNILRRICVTNAMDNYRR